MQKDKIIAIRVGLTVLISIILFITALGFISRWHLAREGFTMNVKFAFLNNLSEGAPVIVGGGVQVGHVQKIYQKDLKTYIKIYLDNSLKNKIPKNKQTQFAIFTKGWIGQKYVNINIGEAQEEDEFFKEGDEAVGVDPPSIDQMLLAFSSWFDGKSGGQVLAQIIHETKLFIDNLNSIVSENKQDIRLTIQTTRQSIGALSKQLDILVARLNILSKNFVDISNKNKNDIEIMLANISLISRDLNLITKRINSGKGSIGKFINDDQIYLETRETIRNAKEFFDIVKSDPWKLLYRGR